MKTCPGCNREVPDKALICMFCNTSLIPARPPAEATQPPSNPQRRLINIGLALAILLGTCVAGQFLLGFMDRWLYQGLVSDFERGDCAKVVDLMSGNATLATRYPDAQQKANVCKAYQDALAAQDNGKYVTALTAFDRLLADNTIVSLRDTIRAHQLSAIESLAGSTSAEAYQAMRQVAKQVCGQMENADLRYVARASAERRITSNTNDIALGEFQATTPGEVHLVLCVTDHSKLVEECVYTNGLRLNRVRHDWTAQIRSITEKRVIAEHSFQGQPPPACPGVVHAGGGAAPQEGFPLIRDLTQWLRIQMQ